MAGKPRADDPLDASVWLGVGMVGIFVFVAGIWKPATAHLPYSAALQVVLAIAGGATAYLGLSRWWDARDYEKAHPKVRPLRGRAREVAIAPSFEVYDPRAMGPAPAVAPALPEGEPTDDATGRS